MCTTLFYGYDLGFYVWIGDARGVPLMIAISMLQIPVSVW